MRFENQTFTTEVTLDYNEFVGCTLSNCVVHYHGGTFSLVRTTLDHVAFSVHDAAHNILTFLRMVRDANPKALEELINQAPAVTANRVTIN